MLASAVAATELGILLGQAPVRVAAGLILALVLPGLVITRVILFRTRIEATEHLLLVPGTSVAVAVITGLVLNAAHIRLTAANWAIALGLVTAAGLVGIAILERDHRLGASSGCLRSWVTAASGGARSLGIGPAAMFVVAALTVGTAVVVGVLGQRDEDAETQFTELWALPGSHSASTVLLGVRSHERGDVRYRLRVSIDGRVVRSQGLTLRPGQTWQSRQAVARRAERVDVALLTSAAGRIYRKVHVTAP